MDPSRFLIRHVLFPAWIRKNGSARLLYAGELERTQFLSTDELRHLQWTQFRQVVEHAYKRCPFYRRRFSEAGLTPEDIRTPDDVAKVPLTSKADIQIHADDLIADSFRGRPLVRDMTGGSTGSPMVFYYDEDRRDSRAAATIRHDRWTGWDVGEKMALLWGAPRDVAAAPSLQARVRDWIIGRAIILDASSIDEERMLGFCLRLRKYQPKYLLAYANTLALFARFVKDRRIDVCRPNAIICSGEFLTEDDRALIESTFHCRVFNRYGSREFAVIASECDVHRGMHVNAENLLVEAGDGSACGANGEIVITDLRNYAMPMIRYRTMDAGVLKQGACRCGRGLPLLELTGGRVTDFLTGVSGTRVSGIVVATYGITNIPGIRQVQFVQTRRGAVTARIARGPHWSDESFAALANRLRSYLGDTMAVEAEFVEHIPLETSGKYRFSISTVGLS